MSEKVVFVEFEIIFLNIKIWEWDLAKNFTSFVLKRFCLGLSRNIFSGSRCMRLSETSHHRCLRGALLQNLNENTTIS